MWLDTQSHMTQYGVKLHCKYLLSQRHLPSNVDLLFSKLFRSGKLFIWHFSQHNLQFLEQSLQADDLFRIDHLTSGSFSWFSLYSQMNFDRFAYNLFLKNLCDTRKNLQLYWILLEFIIPG